MTLPAAPCGVMPLTSYDRSSALSIASVRRKVPKRACPGQVRVERVTGPIADAEFTRSECFQGWQQITRQRTALDTHGCALGARRESVGTLGTEKEDARWAVL